jgi:hypothetical protein
MFHPYVILITVQCDIQSFILVYSVFLFACYIMVVCGLCYIVFAYDADFTLQLLWNQIVLYKYTVFTLIQDDVIAHRVKHVMDRYFPENWRSWGGVTLCAEMSYIQVSMVCSHVCSYALDIPFFSDIFFLHICDVHVVHGYIVCSVQHLQITYLASVTIF